MSTTPDCPYCHSPDVHRLNTAVTGVAGYRCDACKKIFYKASAHVAKRIEEARPRGDTPDDTQPLRRTVPKKE
jgi:transposase-like protein